MALALLDRAPQDDVTCACRRYSEPICPPVANLGRATLEARRTPHRDGGLFLIQSFVPLLAFA